MDLVERRRLKELVCRVIAAESGIEAQDLRSLLEQWQTGTASGQYPTMREIDPSRANESIRT